MAVTPLPDAAPVITGIGVLSGTSVGVGDYWTQLTTVDRVETPTAIEGFEGRDWVDRRHRRRSGRPSHLAVAAARLALRDAADPVLAPDRTAVVLGISGLSESGYGRGYEQLRQGREVDVDPSIAVEVMMNNPPALVALELATTGPTFAVGTACASGGDALGRAAALVAGGEADLVLAGAVESTLSGPVAASLRNLKVMSDEAVPRPFDADRRGFVAAEGVAVMVVERADAAAARGATAYGSIAGYGCAADSHDMIQAAPDGCGLQQAVTTAVAQAGIHPSEVRQVNAHGSATVLNDRVEGQVIAALGGGPAVTAVKPAVGHTLGAAGAMEAVAVLLSFRHGELPHIAGLRTRDDEFAGLDLVEGRPRPWEPGLTLSTSLGLGGHNAALVFAP